MPSALNFNADALPGTEPDVGSVFGVDKPVGQYPLVMRRAGMPKGAWGAAPSSQMGSVLDALGAFYRLSATDRADLANRLEASGFLLPKAKRDNTPTELYNAYKAAVVDAARGGMTVDEVLTARAGEFGGTGVGAPSAIDVVGGNIGGGNFYTVTLRHPSDIAKVFDVASTAALGRKATTEEKARFLDRINRDDTIWQRGNIAVKEAEARGRFSAGVQEEATKAAARHPGTATTAAVAGGAGVSPSRLTQAVGKYLGINYVWGGGHGGGNPQITGLDCSGFVAAVFHEMGVNLGGTSRTMAASTPTKGDLSTAQPGDLLFLGAGSKGGVHHVAVYLGNGQIAEAPRRGLKTRIRAVSAKEGWSVHQGPLGQQATGAPVPTTAGVPDASGVVNLPNSYVAPTVNVATQPADPSVAAEEMLRAEHPVEAGAHDVTNVYGRMLNLMGSR